MSKKDRERERRVTVERFHRLKDREEAFVAAKAATIDKDELRLLAEQMAAYRQRHRERDIARGKRAPGFSVTMHQIMWARWIEVSAEHEIAAMNAFARINGGDHEALLEELRASLVAVTAAAYTVEALYEDVRYLIPKRGELDSASLTIADVLGAAFGLPPGQADTLQDELEWLFERRNEAVHAYAEPEAPQVHPSGVVTAAEASRFNGHESRRALGVALLTLEIAEAPPVPDNAWVLRWATMRAPYFRTVVEPIRERI